MQRIVVFCGSNPGFDEAYTQQARQLGNAMAQQGIGLVYGGAKIGVMGAVADGVLEQGGEVIGVLPHFLKKKEVAHEGLTDMIMTDTMHQRKTKMNELCDGVIALPGGFGTLEELFEMLTWGQLGLHQKPIGLLNTKGFYNALITLLDTMVEQGLLKEANRKMLLVSDNIDDLLAQMRAYKPEKVSKWLSDKTL